MKKALKLAGIVVSVIVLILIIYVVYVFASFHRIEDHQALIVENAPAGMEYGNEIYGEVEAAVPVGDELIMTSSNIGFGAYSDDYTFFMDGGTESRARSVEDVTRNIEGCMEAVASFHPDIALVQETDIDGTRSLHIDERSLVVPGIANKDSYDYTFAQNYDSPYLMYPLYSPHGANKAGILTFSKYKINGAERISLPIENGISKVLDLDRCYSKNRTLTENGKELVVYNLHLSAYTANADTAETQLSMLIHDMQEEYDAGNYCVAGGDFNRDLLGNSPEIFHTAVLEDNWAQPVNMELFTDDISLVVPYSEKTNAASCRNPDKPYEPGDFVVTVDGFIISGNIELISSDVIDTGFQYSDHNPVYMAFRLSDSK